MLKASRRVRIVFCHLASESSRRTEVASQHRRNMSRSPLLQSDQSTAGIIIIGDEILKGQTPDTNSHFICKRLFSLGVKVRKISVIVDDLDSIAEEVAQFSRSYSHVITAGGVGPTHDDLTFEGVAKAFGEPLVPHPELVQLIKEYFGTEDLSSPKMKMAYIPRSAKLVYGEDRVSGKRIKYPLITVRNVFMFPGVPSLLEKSFYMVESQFKNPSVEFHTKELYLRLDEMSITHVLNTVNEQFKKCVVLGSYPNFHNSYYKVKLTLESLSLEQLQQVYDCLLASLPPGSVIDYDKDPFTHTDRMYDLNSTDLPASFRTNLQTAIGVIEECLDKYRLEEICVGFNGGKDCTALLHLFHTVVNKKFPESKEKLKALYIRSKLPFPEVEKFIQISRDNYNLEMLKYDGRIKECLADLKEQHSVIKAILMGTRYTDPHSDHLQFFSMTDPDWPQFVRVTPLLRWSYDDIWLFLRSLCLPYCNLYDKGYTSLGSMNDTHPNPILQYFDEHGIVCYKPAYELKENMKERDGRNT